MAAGQWEAKDQPEANSSIMAAHAASTTAAAATDPNNSATAWPTNNQAPEQITTNAGSERYATATAAPDRQWGSAAARDCNESVVNKKQQRPLILITESANENQHQQSEVNNARPVSVERGRVGEEQVSWVGDSNESASASASAFAANGSGRQYAGDKKKCGGDGAAATAADPDPDQTLANANETNTDDGEQYEEIDGIRYRIVAAVTKPPRPPIGGGASRRSAAGSRSPPVIMELDDSPDAGAEAGRSSVRGADPVGQRQQQQSGVQKKFNSIRRKSSAMVANLTNFLGPSGSVSSHELGSGPAPQRRLSVYEMTKSPPPETSLEIYLSERRRSSTISSKQLQQQLEQQTTFETNYCQRQQYFKDLNQKFINQDNKLLNVVANRGNIHRHSVDIAQLPLHLAQAKAQASKSGAKASATAAASGDDQKPQTTGEQAGGGLDAKLVEANLDDPEHCAINQSSSSGQSKKQQPLASALVVNGRHYQDRSLPMEKRGSTGSRGERHKKSRIVIRKFQKLDKSLLHSTPAPDVKIGQRVAYKEYYGNEFGTIRWIGRVPQICPDWTVGVEFDNAIGEGDGSLNGRRYFIAKDCFAKFLSLNDVALVDQHVGRPEPGTMISVMSAAVRPGQMISIQRVSTVHVQHCFLNAPHQIPGADILAVNTRLHCQCPNCGPCAHVIKPPRTQRIARAGKNATHMCQFSTYTCCGMESQEETMCTYKGNKAASLPPPTSSTGPPFPSVGNSWFEGAGYLSQLQAQQSKLMPEEYRLGAAPEDILNPETLNRRLNRSSSSRRGSGKQHHHEMIQPTDAAMPTDGIIPTHLENNVTTPNFDQIGCPPSYTPPSQEFNYKQQNHSFAPMTYPDRTNWVEPVWCEPSEPSSMQQAKNTPKSAKVVYRDSIENRYLFPTDDPIDSKLEADLENLSQARYGHCTNSRLNGPRNIFKSLRSLVSCLSAQSNRSELDRHSEDTLRFSEHRDKAGNKSVPAIMSNAKPQRFSEAQNVDDSPIISSSNNYTSSSTAKNYASNHNASISSVYTKEGKDDFGSSNCGFGSDSQKLDIINSQDQIRRHVSSSSDCGFSSASQNSIPNYHQTNLTRPCTPLVTTEEQRKRYLIYKDFLDQLIVSTTLKNEELNGLERILFGRNQESCLLHNNLDGLQNGECEQLIIDKLRKSYMDAKGQISYEQVQRAASACCHSTNNCISSSGLDMTYKLANRMNDDDETRKLRHVSSSKHPRSLGGNSSISDSATSSSNDSFRAGSVSVNGIDVQSTSNSNNLPKAFELKLTLSINSDKSNNDSRCGSDVRVGNITQQNSSQLNSSSVKIDFKSSNLEACTTKSSDDGNENMQTSETLEEKTMDDVDEATIPS